MTAPLVLVTGGSGFVGAHVIVELLERGLAVRTTVRSAQKEKDVRGMVGQGGADPGRRLSFAVADLTRDEGWDDAVAGCEYVLHVASPFPSVSPRHDEEVIGQARDGVLRVLRAARDAGVRRVVLTSSFAAIGYSPKPAGAAYTEDDWTSPDQPGLSAYVRSKTIAERAAWDFMAREGGSLELAVINPVGIFGPVLGRDYSSSIELVRRLLDGSMPVVPRLFFGVVDVRDVAVLHVVAMTSPAAAGERFLAAAGEQYGLPAMARLFREQLGAAGRQVPSRVIPDWAVRFGGRFSGPLRAVAPEVGKRKTFSNAKAREVLGWQPRSNEEAVLATARSLLGLGLARGREAS